VHSARFQASPRENHLKATKGILKYLKHTQNIGLWYPKGAKFELIGYSNSDYVGCKFERKSTLGTCQLLERSLVSWSSKKQNSVTLLTAEAKYISIGSCCTQILWMKATLNDFEIKFNKVPLLYDNESVIKLTNNLVQHARIKHIYVRHHFISDHQQKGDICIESVGTEDQLADIFTKPLNEKRFCKLRNKLKIFDFSNIC
jgi:hypothetical protein